MLAGIVAADAVGVGMWLALSSGPELAELAILRSLPAFLTAAVAGALVLHRQPANRAGAALLGVGGAFAVLALVEGYAHIALLGRAVPLPGGVAAGWVGRWMWIVVFALVAVVLLLVPDGRLPGRRWGWAAWALAVGTFAMIVVNAVAPGSLDDPYPEIANPLGVPPAWASVLEPVGAVAGWVFFGSILVCGASLLFRYSTAGPVQRQQLKWVGYAGALVAVTTVVHSTLGQTPAVASYTRLAGDLAFLALFAAFAIAILRHRLFDIDVVINRTVVYGLLAVFVTAVYVAVVIGVGRLLGGGARLDPVLSVAATVLVAVAFAPVREWLRGLANRWVYGERRSPYELLTELGRRLAGSLSADELLPTIAHAAAAGVGATAAEVRVALPCGGEQRAGWPTDAPLPHGEARVIPVRTGAQKLGHIAVLPRPGFPLTRVQRRLIDDLARQSALAVSNAQLTAELADQLVRVSEQADELRASRQRLVTAQDQERRRLERDLHDGAQQQLVAVTLALRAAASRAPGSLARSLEQIREQVTDTLGTLRALARGVFPPLLAEAGLGPAVHAHIARTRLPIKLDDRIPDGVRADPEAEAALYFCCLEAVQNATKHAPAATVSVLLWADGDGLGFEVRDEGPGFDLDQATVGTGLTNMTDRMAAVDGDLSVRSRSDEGTTVRGRAPLAAATSAAPAGPHTPPPNRTDVARCVPSR